MSQALFGLNAKNDRPKRLPKKLRQPRLDDLPGDIGEAIVAALETVRETQMIKAEEM